MWAARGRVICAGRRAWSRHARIAIERPIKTMHFSTESGGDTSESPLSSGAEEQATEALEPLTSYMPTDVVVHSLEYLHSTVGLEWYQSIIAATVVTRLCLAPVAVKMMSGASKMAYAGPEVKRAVDAYKAQKISADEYAMRVKTAYKKVGISSPMSAMIGPMFIQFPVFMSFFFGVKKLQDYVDLSAGGTLWFQDLSICDPYYILPVTTSLSFWLAFELNADGTRTNEQTKYLPMIMRGMAVCMIPITSSFPTAVLVYWNANNLFSLCQVAVLKIPGLKPALGIRPPPPKATVGVASLPSTSPGPTVASTSTVEDTMRSEPPPRRPSTTEEKAAAVSTKKKKPGRKRRRAGRRRS